MTRLIDADKLKEYIDAQKGRPFIGCTIGEALKIMTDEQPTVDAEPVRHARLVNAQPYGECSCCGGLIDSRDRFRYCPYCGARLDGDKHGTD